MIRLESRLLELSEVAFAEEVIGNLRKQFNVDLAPILRSHLPYAEKKKRAAGALLDAIFDKAKREGYLEDWHQGSPNCEAEDALLDAMLASDVDIEPNFTIVPTDVPTILSYRGNDVKDYVYMLTKRFENASNAKTPGQAAGEIIGGGVLSVGLAATKLAIDAYRAGGTTFLGAARAGIAGLGMKTAISVIVFALVGLLLFLFLENPKKILGIVMNDTDENLTVNKWRDGLTGANQGDLYMAHGDMKSFMADHPSGLSSPEVQVNHRTIFGKDDPDNFISAGIYFSDKKFGLRGAEGVMVFSTSVTKKRIALFFASPYTNDNGTNMDVIGDVTPESVFRGLYDARKVSMQVTKDGYFLQSSVNEPRGGVVAAISYIRKA
ncbi:hypothetical protein ASF22_11635 [Methylobacterium sp. Leaf87]|uniref:hypothetical protein n=1 Tax=Methylobacterium sp. Leaf87 TaxID=1736243 RepID=UPI0006F22E72|nr:hypothetical protein [Methylobacterium sp. Leaf87]KQO55248.1 hypothetical protein ASF22_11635 [Methylobacterium sp. Leaf87]